MNAGYLILGGIALCGSSSFGQQVDSMLDERIRSELSLDDYSIQVLDVPKERGSGFEVEVSLAGESVTLILRPTSVRAPGFRLRADVGDGVLVDIPAPREECYRGVIDGLPGTRVRAGFEDGNLCAMIRYTDGTTWSIEPLASLSPGSLASVVYDSADTIALPFGCGVETGRPVQVNTLDGRSPFSSRSVFALELAVDADYEYLANKFGGDLVAATNDINNILNFMDQVYETDLEMDLSITEMIIRTSPADPYPDCNPSLPDPAAAMLNQFRTHWELNHTNVLRDAAMLFTGKFMVLCDGQAIGVAYTPGICDDLAYSLCESKFGGGSLSGRVALHSHELGHNLNAVHCSGSGCHIMCPTNAGCGGLGGFPPVFGSLASSTISAFASTKPCIEQTSIPDIFVETWATASIDAQRWSANSGGQIDTLGILEPSPPYSLMLDGTDEITSAELQLAPLLAQGGAYLSFWVEQRGPDGTDQFHAEVLTALGSFDSVEVVAATGEAESRYTFYECELPFFAYHDLARLRFRAVGGASSDEWRVDDVRVSLYCRVDVSRDGLLNSSDFIAFLNRYASQDPDGDWNRDGVYNTSDFIHFLNDYVAGCPAA